MTKKKEYTDEDIEFIKHQDFKNKEHNKDCKCGYCEMRKMGLKILK